MSTVNCPRCGAENPESNKFCGQCALAITPEDLKIRATALSVVEEQLNKRDQKLLEIETANAIVRRVYLGFTPLALTIAFAAWFGFAQYRTALDAISSTKSAAIQSLQTQTASEWRGINEQASQERATLKAATQIEARELRTNAGQGREQLRQAQVVMEQMLQQGNALKTKYENAFASDALISPAHLGSGQLVTLTPTPTVTITGVTAQPSRVYSTGIAGFQSSTDFIEPLTTFSLGSSGPEVAKIQTRLKDLGCYAGDITGQYDQFTREAVVRFNQYRGEVFPSGVVDPVGWMNLFSPLVSAPRGRADATTSGGITITNLSSFTSGPIIGAVTCP